MDNRQQIAALQKAAAHHEGMRPDGPVAQLADLADETQLLHGGQQAVSGGVGQTRLLRQLGQRDAAVRLGNPFEQFQAAGQRLNLTASLLGGGSRGFSAAFRGNGGSGHRGLLFLYRGNDFRFIWR